MSFSIKIMHDCNGIISDEVKEKNRKMSSEKYFNFLASFFLLMRTFSKDYELWVLFALAQFNKYR